MLAGSAGEAKSEADFWKMVLNEAENHKPGLGEFFLLPAVCILSLFRRDGLAFL